VDQELARAKIAATVLANHIKSNLNTLSFYNDEYRSLFPDTHSLVLKASDDLKTIIEGRIDKRKLEMAEADRKAEEMRKAKELADEQARLSVLKQRVEDLHQAGLKAAQAIGNEEHSCDEEKKNERATLTPPVKIEMKQTPFGAIIDQINEKMKKLTLQQLIQVSRIIEEKWGI
jgi:hypothetical protein